MTPHRNAFTSRHQTRKKYFWTVRRFPYFPNNIFEEYFWQFFWTQTAQIFFENIPRKKRSKVQCFFCVQEIYDSQSFKYCHPTVFSLCVRRTFVPHDCIVLRRLKENRNGSSSGDCVGSAKAAPYADHLLMKTNALPTTISPVFGLGWPRMFETVARTPPGDRYRNFGDSICCSFFFFFLWIVLN